MPELLPYAPGSPEWLAARRAGVTATDIVTILGLSSWSSPYSLYWRKLGQVPESEDNDRWRLGRFNEPYVIERWGEAHPDTPIMAGGLHRSTDRPWQMATLDAWAYSAPLEVKTWADADRHSWGQGCRDGVAGLLILDGKVPPAVRAQVLWQMDVMDVATGHVGVVFLPSGEFRSYTIEGCGGRGEADECDYCKDILLMRDAGAEFMARLRLELPAPDPDASAATLAAVKARFAKAPDKTAEVDGDLYSNWCSARFDAERLTGLARGYENKMREQAGEASVYTVDGQPVARRIVAESQVKAHTRRMDYLKRIKTEADSE